MAILARQFKGTAAVDNASELWVVAWNKGEGGGEQGAQGSSRCWEHPTNRM